MLGDDDDDGGDGDGDGVSVTARRLLYTYCVYAYTIHMPVMYVDRCIGARLFETHTNNRM